MDYKVRYKESVEKDLKKIDTTEIKRIFNKIDSQLKKSPTPGNSLTGQFKGLYKYRIGDYRVIYSINNDRILILKIAHRKGVYKK